MADVRGYVQSQFGGPVSAAQAAMQQRSLMHQGAHMRPAPGVMAGSPGADRGRVFARVEAGIDEVFEQIDAAGGQITRPALQLADRVLRSLDGQTGPEADFARSVLKPLLDANQLEVYASEAFVAAKLSLPVTPASSEFDSGESDDEVAVGRPAGRASIEELKITQAIASTTTVLTGLKDLGKLAIGYAESGPEQRAHRDGQAEALQLTLQGSYKEATTFLSCLENGLGDDLLESLSEAETYTNTLWAHARDNAQTVDASNKAAQAQDRAQQSRLALPRKPGPGPALAAAPRWSATKGSPGGRPKATQDRHVSFGASSVAPYVPATPAAAGSRFTPRVAASRTSELTASRPAATSQTVRNQHGTFRLVNNSGRGLKCGYYAMAANLHGNEGLKIVVQDQLRVDGFLTTPNDDLSQLSIDDYQYALGEVIYKFSESEQGQILFAERHQEFQDGLLAARTHHQDGVIAQTGLQDEAYLDDAELARTTIAEAGVLAIPVDVNRQRLSILAAHFGAELVCNEENPSGNAHMPVLRLHNPRGGHYQAMIPTS